MRIQRPYWLFAGLLALALLAAGCDAGSIGGGPPIGVGQPRTSAASPAPTQPPATATPAETATSVPSATPQPATPPPAAPTSAPEATAAPSALLPVDRPWVRLGNTITAQGQPARTLDLGAVNAPAVRNNVI